MATNYNNKIVTDGLVLCLDAGDRKSYSGSGTTWTDRSGNGYNGSLESTTFDSDNGGSIEFDGADSYVTLSDISDLEGASFTFSIWVKFNTTTGDLDILTKGTHSTNEPILIWRDKSVGSGSDVGNTDAISFMMTGTSSQVWIASPTDSVSDITKYYNIVCRHDLDNDTQAIYIDGASVRSISNTNNGMKNTSSSFVIGADTNQSFMLNANVSSVLFYNKALTDAEILQNFNAQRGRFGI